MPSVVVDTNVIIDSCTGDGKAPIDCFLIFVKINDGLIQLGVDSEGKILEEYQEKIKKLMKYPTVKMIQKFIEKETYNTSSERKIVKIIPIRERDVEDLIELGFHQKDIKFVRIASKSDLKIIVSTDSRSFLEPSYSSWIYNNLKVSIKHPSDFLKII